MTPHLHQLLIPGLIGAVSTCAIAAPGAEFADPVRIEAGGEFVKTEEPGYACPAWWDIDRDGQKDLIVGQFAGGKMKIYRGTEAGLSTGEWLMAGEGIAEVPGVW